MKKCSREQIKKHRVFGKELCLTKEYNRKCSTYQIFTKDTVLVIAVGKELKGYKDSILTIKYDGEEYGTGNYYLVSDIHGVICKWKDK